MGKYRVLGALLDRVFRNNLNANFDDIDNDIKAQKQRVDDLIKSTPQPSEVVDSRGGFPVLGDRLNDLTTNLAQKATKDETGNIIDLLLSAPNLVQAINNHFLRFYFVTITEPRFGAKTTNTAAQNDVAIQAAINLVQNNGGGRVVVPDGVFQYNEVKITKPFITITGSGTLINGHILIGDEVLPADLHFTIETVTLKHDLITEGKHGIELQNARIGKIKKALFRNCDKSVYVRPINGAYFQHSNKVSITDNDFKNVNYCLYIDRPASPTQAYQVGDFTFSSNKAFGDVHKGHVYGLGVDGLSCIDNFLFFPGSTAQSATKENNIYIDVGNWIDIIGNKLFEAGKEAVLLSKCRNFTITSNPIAWAGQRVASDAIRIINGDPQGATTNNSSISNNPIDSPTRHGISVEGPSGRINVDANPIRSAGLSTYYYGAENLSSMAHFGVNVEATCQFVNVTDNIMPDNTLNVLGDNNHFANNLEQGFIVRNKNLVLTLSGTETTVAVGKYHQVNLNQSAPTTITSFTGGYDGKELTLIGFNGNTTLAHGTGNDQIRFSDGVSKNIPLNGTMKLIYTSNRWYKLNP